MNQERPSPPRPPQRPAPSADVTARPHEPVAGPNTRGLLIACSAAAVMLGLAMFLAPHRASAPNTGRPEPEAVDHTFLDRNPVEPEAAPPAEGEPWWSGYVDDETDAAAVLEPKPWESEPPAAPEAPDPRARAFERALRSSQFRAAANAASGSAAGPEDRIVQAIEALTASGDLEGPLSATSGRSTSPGAEPRRAPVVPRSLPPLARGTLPAGTVLLARLETSINSDAPGPVTARITQAVRDGRSGDVLIPAGARLLGSTDRSLALGGGRVLVSFDRLVLPDRSYSLPPLGAGETDGTGGLTGRVDRHLLPNLGRAALLAVVGAGFQLAQPRTRSGDALTSREIVAAQVGLELDRVASQTLARGLERRPTVRVRAGTRLAVYVHHDLVL